MEGRPNVPPLHDYQVTIVEDVMDLCGRDRDNKACSRCLRVPAKLVLRSRVSSGAVLEERLGSGPMLWVAQSNELCEQAVAAWTEMWRMTDTHLDLTISRLWSTNQADRAPTEMCKS